MEDIKYIYEDVKYTTGHNFFVECRTRQTAYGKLFVGKTVFAKCYFSTLGKAFNKCPALDKD
jgi:hypothetical protein